MQLASSSSEPVELRPHPEAGDIDPDNVALDPNDNTFLPPVMTRTTERSNFAEFWDSGSFLAFDGDKFWANLATVACFPFSVPLLMRADAQWLSTLAVLSQAVVPVGMYYVYVVMWWMLEPDVVEHFEVIVPLPFLLVLIVDTAMAAASSVHVGKAAAFESSLKAACRAKGIKLSSVLLNKQNRATLADVIQIVSVQPSGAPQRHARHCLARYDVYLPVENREAVDGIGPLKYDYASPDNDASTVTEAVHLGRSYKRQVIEDGRVKLVNVADQLVYGIKQATGSSRFFVLLRGASVVVLGLLVAAVPTLLRLKDDTLGDMNTADWILAIIYMPTIGYLTMQLGAVLLTTIDVFGTEASRAHALGLLLNSLEARENALPVLDFSNGDHVFAWMMLRQYVTKSSADSLRLYSQRIALYFLGLLAGALYLISSYARDALQEEALITSVIGIAFMVFLVNFLVIVFVGALANAALEVQHESVLRKGLAFDEVAHFNRIDNTPDVQALARSLKSLHTFVLHYEPVALLGVKLDFGVLSTLGSALGSLAAFLVPVVLDALGVQEE